MKWAVSQDWPSCDVLQLPAAFRSCIPTVLPSRWGLPACKARSCYIQAGEVQETPSCQTTHSYARPRRYALPLSQVLRLACN